MTVQLPRRVARAALGVVLGALGAWVLLDAVRYRGLEAWSAARLVEAVVGGGTLVDTGRATLYVGLHTEHPLGLRIDQVCSTAAITGAVLLVTAALITWTRVRLTRVLVACVAASGLVLAVNVSRLTALSWSIVHGGRTGWFEWLHLYGGAFVTMLAVALSCLAYLALLRRPVAGPRHR